MTTQVIFKIEKSLKEQAIKKARSEGIALTSMLKMATKAFVSGELKVGLIKSEKFNSKTEREIKAAIKDFNNNKNISTRLHSAKEVMDYLKK
jgi:hypothetical protein